MGDWPAQSAERAGTGGPKRRAPDAAHPGPTRTHARDRTFREDESKIRTGHLPRTMASLRNLAVGVHRQNGQTSMAAALRRAARDYCRPLAAFGLT